MLEPWLQGGGRPVSGGALRCGLGVGGLLLAILLPIGCGGGIVSPDLFIVQRSGDVAGASLTLVVNDGGTVRCDGGQPLPIGDAQLVQARGIQEELQEAASNHQSLSAKAGSVFSYYLRDQDGTVRFSDNSEGQSRVMRELQRFVLEVGRNICHQDI